MDIFQKYFKKPSNSVALNTKLLLLTKGLDFDFETIKKEFKNTRLYKINQVRVSDRHFMDPASKNRHYIPDEFIFKDGKIKTLSKVYYKKESPLLLTHDGERFLIKDKEGNFLPLEMEPMKRPKYADLEFGGHQLNEFVSILGKDRISIFPFEGCEHWTVGKQCTFCGANPKRLKFRKYKHDVYDIKSKFFGNYDKWWQEKEDFILSATEEAIKKLLELDRPEPHIHLFVLSGGLIDNNYAWEIGMKVSRLVNKHLPLKEVDSYLNLTPPSDLSYLEKAKALGFQQICYNLEVYGKEKFKEVCPGKNSAMSFEKFLKSFERVVEIFGLGNARSNFVLGAQPLPELVKGAKEIAKQGIVSDYSIFFPRPGSVWRNKKTLPADDIIDFTRKLVAIYKEHNFRPFCCAESSRSSIANEIYQLEYL